MNGSGYRKLRNMLVIGSTLVLTASFASTASAVPTPSEDRSTSSVLTSTPPSAPRSIAGKVGNEQVTVTWSAPSAAGSSPITTYNVYYATSSTGPWTSAGSTVVTTRSKIVANLTNGTPYFFRVTAVNGSGEGAAGTIARAVTPSAPPSAPRNLVITPGADQAVLSWDVPSNNGGSPVTSYAVSRAVNSAGPWTTAVSQVTGTTTTVRGLTASTPYFFRVTATNSGGISPAVIGNATTNPATEPGAPTNVKGTRGAGQVTVAWTAPLNAGGAPITGYKISYATSSSGPWTLFGTSTRTSQVVSGLENGTPYWFRVVAVNSVGDSEPGVTAASVTPSTVPTAPRNLEFSAGANQMTLSWQVPTSDGGSPLTGYDISRATSASGPWTTVASRVPNTTAVATGLVAGTNYFFRVIARNLSGSSPALVGSQQTLSAAVPSAPQTLRVSSVGSTQVALNWAAPANNGGSIITGYTASYSTSPTGPWTIASTGSTTLGASVRNLNASTLYYFRVVANNSAGAGTAATVSATTTGATRPGAPFNITLEQADSTSLYLYWFPPADTGGAEITGYEVSYATSAVGPWTVAADLTPDTSINIDGLRADQTYHIRIAAANESGKGSFVLGTAKTAPPSLPSEPGNLFAAPSNNRIALTWAYPGDDGGASITSYTVYQSNSAEGPWEIAATGITGTGRTITGLTNDTQYWFQVTATNSAGEGPAVTLTEPVSPVRAVPGEPQNISTVGGDKQATISWRPPLSDGGMRILSYSVYYSESSTGPWTLAAANVNELSRTVTGLTNGTPYFFQVTAVNFAGEGDPGTSSAVTPAGAPSPPRNLSTVRGSGQILLSWLAPLDNNGAEVAGYKIYTASTASGPWELANGNVSETNATIGDLSNGAGYWFRVTAVNSAGESLPVASITATTPAEVPGAPRGVNASRGNAQATVSWSAPTTNGGATITSYTVYQSTSADGPWELAASGVSGTSRTVTGLENGTAYFFKVTASNVIGEGEGTVSSTAVTPTAPPSAPQNLATTAGNSLVNVTWDAPANAGGSAITSYTVSRATSAAGPWTTVSSAAANSTSSTVTGLTNGTRYWFRVVANNAAGAGTAATTDSSTTPATVPSSPRNVAAIAGDQQVTVSWAAPTSTGGSAVNGYTVYQATSASGPWIVAASDITSTSTTITGLENGINYWLYVTANNAIGEGLASATVTAATATLAAAPTGIVASPGNTQVTVSWTPPTNTGGGAITSYSVYRSTSSEGPWTRVSTGSLSTSRVVSGLTNGTGYFFRVTANTWAGEGAPATTATAVTPATVPGIPTNFTATAGSGEVLLAWGAPTSDGGAEVTGYSVSFAPSSNGPWTKFGADSLATSRTVTGLANGTPYFFRVSAMNAAGVGNTTTATATPATVPGAPASVNAAAGNTQATVTWTVPSWNGGSAVTGYTVSYATSAEGPWTEAATGVTGTSRTVTGLENGTGYFFRVSASNAAGAGMPLATTSAVTPATMPGTPTGLTTEAGDESVTLAWVAPVSNGSALTGYSVYYATSAEGPWTKFGADSLTTARNVTGLANGTPYWFRVTASNIAGEGNPVTTSTSTTPATTPSAPRNLTVTDGAGQVSLAWSAPATDGGAEVTSYIISQATSASGPWTQIATGVTGATRTVTGLQDGTVYWFRIVAVNSVGAGESVTGTGTPVSAPEAPSGLTATPGNASVGLTWSAPSDTGGASVTYAVEYGTSSTGPWVSSGTGLTANSRTVTGLENGTGYFFRVSTTNRSGETVYTVPVAATPATVPGTPRSLTTTAGTGQVTLAWSAPSNNGGATISGYSVYRATSSTGPWTKFGTDSLATTRVVTGLTNGTPYWFRVTATNAMGEGAVTNSTSSTTPATTPDAPRNLVATAGTGQVSLSWAAPTWNGGAAVTAYSVYTATSASGPWTKFGTDSSATSRTVTGLTNGTGYFFRVTATNWVGEGTALDTTSATTPATVPSAPQNLSTTGSSGQITASWTAPSNNGGAAVTGYTVYYSLNQAGPWTVGATNVTGTSATVTGLVNGNSYWIRVTATNWAGEGAELVSTSATATITVPTLPVLNPLVPGNGQVTVSWSAPSSDGGSPITDYTVEYGNSATGPWTVFNDGTSTTTSATVTGLLNGTAYWFRVTAINLAGSGAVAVAGPTTPRTTASAPQNLVAGLGGASGSVSLSWSAPSNNGGAVVTGYNVYSGTSSTGPWTLCLTTSLTGINCTGLTNGTAYWFRVAANNEAGEGAAVVTSSSTTPIAAPNAAGSVAATSTAVGTGSLSVTWTRNATTAQPITSGTVRACTDTGMSTGCLTPVAVSGTATSASMDNAAQNTLYYVRVDLSNNSGTTVSTTASIRSAYNATFNAAFNSCGIGGSTLSGSTCGYTATFNPSYYYCTIGGSTLSGTACGYAATNNGPTCPSGWSRSGYICFQSAPQTNYTCSTLTPSNGSLSGTTCTISATNAGTAYASTCPSGFTMQQTCPTSSSTACARWTCPAGYTPSGSSCLKTCTETYTVAVYKVCGNTTSADCKSGGTKVTCSGTVNPRTLTCTRNVSCNIQATLGYSTCNVAGTNYTCPSGWAGGGLNNPSCFRAANISSYTCTNGGSTPGPYGVTGICSYNTTDTFSCPSGGTYNTTWNGLSNRCVYNATQASAFYSCPSGGTYAATWNGLNNQCTYAATNNPAFYTCPSGGTVSGTVCRY